MEVRLVMSKLMPIHILAAHPPRYAPNRKEIEIEQILKNLTLDFFGKGKHKITPEKFFEIENVFLLDVRSKEEASFISIRMEYHSNVESIHIPINEIPGRINEIPKEKFVAVFLSCKYQISYCLCLFVVKRILGDTNR